MVQCINLLLDQKHLLLYQILQLQDIFFVKMHFPMTRYDPVNCNSFDPIYTFPWDVSFIFSFMFDVLMLIFVHINSLHSVYLPL